jgi:hypothetical protein
MTNKKEISLMLLGIIAILAIVGLVLLFSKATTTGEFARAATPSSIIVVPPELPCEAAPLCPNGRPPVDLNLPLYDIETGTYNRACWCELPRTAIVEMPFPT